MNTFETSSPGSDLKTSTERDFIYEYLTTVNPFDIQTTDEVPGTHINEYNSILIIIYGIGAVLVIFVIYSFCYRCYMPEMSEEALQRVFDADRLRLSRLAERERLALRNLQRLRSQIAVPEQVIENSLNADRNPQSDDKIEDVQDAKVEESAIVHTPPHNEEKFFSKTFLKELCRNTIPKQVAENCQIIFRTPANYDQTKEERRDSEFFCTSEQREETIFSPEIAMDRMILDTVPKQMCQFHDGQKSYEDEDEIQPLEHIDKQSSSVQGRSRSSPTSPNIVRRRYSSCESTPRRSSSWR